MAAGADSQLAGLIMTSIWSTKWAKDGLVAKAINFVGAHWIKSVEEVCAWLL